MHFTLRMPSIPMSGIPSDAGTPPGTKMNLHSLSLFLCLIVTPQIPYCTIVDMLYVCNIILLSLCFTSCSNITLQNNNLNMFIGMRFLSLLVSILLCIFFVSAALEFHYYTRAHRCYVYCMCWHATIIIRVLQTFITSLLNFMHGLAFLHL